MIEDVILANLILNKEYGQKVFPFIKAEYFQNRRDRLIFGLVHSFVDKFKTFPTKEALYIDSVNVSDISEQEFKEIQQRIDDLKIDDGTDLQWLLDQTEEFCSWQAIKNALFQSIRIVEGKDDAKFNKGAIPALLSDALAVSFDTNIGHDFIENWEERFESYHHPEERIPFDIDLLNEITKDGFPRSSLNVLLASTGVGKTLVMCHMAACNLMASRNVLYISLEMGAVGDPSISQRIDANLLDTPLSELMILPHSTYEKRIQRIRDKTKGKLIIKGYPTASAGSTHFKIFLNELKLKRGFVPDIVYVDYLNICVSSRLRYGQNVGSYAYIKSIAEELRGLAQEYNIPLVTATQLNREGSRSSDAGLEHTSESWGLPATADFMAAIISNDHLASLNQYLFKQLKNRYADLNRYSRFIVGVDKEKMRLYNVENSGQEDLIGSKSKSQYDPKGDFLDFK